MVVVVEQLTPQLVVSGSILTRPSSMNNHKALRGADFFSGISAAKQGYAASSHGWKRPQLARAPIVFQLNVSDQIGISSEYEP